MDKTQIEKPAIENILARLEIASYNNLSLAASPAFGRLLWLFAGALGYGLLELFWRGYTHWSMLLAGGLCLVSVNGLDEALPRLADWPKAWLCGLLITGYEFALGLLFNCWWRQDIWDYSELPYNFLGQICLQYSLLWVLISRLLLGLVRWLRPGF